eukprot:1387257-Ditylum_brightwellii.AAC.1
MKTTAMKTTVITTMITTTMMMDLALPKASQFATILTVMSAGHSLTRSSKNAALLLSTLVM